MSISSSAFAMAAFVLLLITLIRNVIASSIQHLRLLEKVGLIANRECPPTSIRIKQSKTIDVSPSGNPVYLVEIWNNCNCKVAHLHLNCGSFKSERTIPDAAIQVMGPNDCLVRNGIPIEGQGAYDFSYVSRQMFPLSVNFYQCLP